MKFSKTLVGILTSVSLLFGSEAFSRGMTKNQKLSFSDRAAHSRNKAATYAEMAKVLSQVENPSEEAQFQYAITLSKVEKWELRLKTFEANAASQAQEEAQLEKERKEKTTQTLIQGESKPPVPPVMKPLALPKKFQDIRRPISQNEVKLVENTKLTLAQIQVPETDDPVTTPKIEPLPDLTRHERVAGLGSSEEYSQKYAREMMNLMHEQGVRMPLHHLESIFTHGLFNFYFNLYFGLSPNFEKKEWVITEHKERLFGTKGQPGVVLCLSKNRELFGARTYDVLHFLARASEKLKENSELRFLGSLFQKQKVRVEFLQKNEDFANLVLESERVELQQLVLARWMQTIAGELMRDILPYLHKGRALNPENYAFLESLPYLRPKFLDDPFYARAFRLLETFNFGPDLNIPEAETNYVNYVKAGFKLQLNCVQDRQKTYW